MNWQDEYRDSLRSIEEINHFFECDFPPISYPIFIPKSFAKKMKQQGASSSLWKQFLPHLDEEMNKQGSYDPIGDKIHSKGNQLIHRYQNRVLFTPLTVCPIICRYCFRKNELAEKDSIFSHNYDLALQYLKNNPSINEIIFTGGDPLILSNEKIAQYLNDFSKIKSIKYIRFHTRTPIILPSRIDPEFLNLLNKSQGLFKKILIMIHTNHSDELDEEVLSALSLLTSLSSVEVYSQTVLLKGVNDQTETLAELFMNLVDIKIKPYYLHHPDQALGAMHFYLDLEAGRRIVHPLHNLLPGWALPQYVIDVPNGEGKIPALNPEKFEFSGTLLNRHGEKIQLL